MHVFTNKMQAILSLLFLLVHLPSKGSEQLWVLDAEGDVFIYEVPTWRLIDRLEVGIHPHGIAATADGRTVFIANERPYQPHGELVWIDTETRKITNRMDVGSIPNEIECTPDGRFIYVPCEEGWQVIDGLEQSILKTIPVKGRPHNTTLSPDHKLMYLSPLRPASEVTVVAIEEDHRIVDTLPFSAAPRPAALSADGRFLYQNVDDLLGFEVFDRDTRQLRRVPHALDPAKRDKISRCHGIALLPDQSEVWSANLEHDTVHIHELTSGKYQQTHLLQMEGGPYWISMSPDGAYAYISLPQPLDERRKWGRRLFKWAFAGLLPLLPGIYFVMRGRRARWPVLLGASWMGVCFALTAGLVLANKYGVGVVAVVDTQTKQVITHLDAGRKPKRTQTIRVSSGNEPD